MSDTPSPETPTGTRPTSTRRKGPPAWGVALALVLLAGLMLVNHLFTSGGEQITWIEDDLAAALQKARQNDQMVFLYLYEPGDETHARNELHVFNQRWAREPLSKVVCCRVAIRKGDVATLKLRNRYSYKGKPLFLLLDQQGNKLMEPAEGAVTELQFFTAVGKPIKDALKRSAQQ
jgi:hypothetical protein